MKRKSVLAIVIAIVCMVTMLSSVLAVNAEEADDSIVISQKNNIAIEEAQEYHWSGTWGHQEYDCEEGDPGFNVFDGNYGNKWGSATVAEGHDQWVSVTFAAAQNVGGVKVWQSTGGYSNIGKFTIQYQNGGEEWIDLKVVGEEDLEFDTNVKGGSIVDAMLWDTYEYLLDTPISVTAMRFYIAATDVIPTATAAEFAEIEIYDDKASVSQVFDGGAGNTGIVPNLTREIEFDPDNTTILCSTQAQPVKNAIDYDFATKWGSAQHSIPQWFTICLDEDTNLAGFALYQDTTWSDVTGMNVEVLVQGKWETVYTLPEGEPMGPVLEVDFDTLWNTDAIRFNFTAVGDGCSRDSGITGDTAHSSVDINEVFIYSGKYVEVTAAPTEDPNKTPAPTKAPVTNPPAATEAPKSEDGGCGSSSAIAQVMLILGAALVIKKKK